MVGFYKHDIPAWMDGTESLSHQAYRAYHVVIQLIMLSEGPIALNEKGIAGRCNMTVRALQHALTELAEAGKISVIDGRIHNGRAARELASIMENRENAGKGGKTRASRQKTGESPANASSKSLKNNDVDQAPLESFLGLKEKRREETPVVPKGTEPDRFSEFEAAYPKRSTAFPTFTARKRWDAFIKAGVDADAIIAGAKAYAAEQSRADHIGGNYVKAADSWLLQRRWQSYEQDQSLPVAEAPKIPPDTWRTIVKAWRDRRGHWPFKGIPEPNQPGTPVPPAILREFGLLDQESARSEAPLIERRAA